MNDTDKVADTLKEKGWYKGDLCGPDGSVCLIGAAFDSLGCEGTWGTQYGQGYIDTKLTPVVMRLYPERVTADPMVVSKHQVAQFNDHPDTTLEDVNLVLKHAREE